MDVRWCGFDYGPAGMRLWRKKNPSHQLTTTRSQNLVKIGEDNQIDSVCQSLDRTSDPASAPALGQVNKLIGAS
jgi:hypothetical protein